MPKAANAQPEELRIAREWCASKGKGWSLKEQLGPGGTAFVFGISSPNGPRALKIYSTEFSTGEKGPIEAKRIAQQVQVGQHECKSLVQVYEGGTFNERLYLLMSRAPGRELEKRLRHVPRDKIRLIVDQVAQAVLFLRLQGLCHRDIKAANIFVSDDFEQATLLDISVIRDIYDPLGMGTDHDGQLPIVATARYSPPEYLFRLIEPSAQAWEALSVYQLGALLHDLIMREPLFQTEYVNSAGNRYRFAWVVATVIPEINASDVDADLVFLARRALQKNWIQRLDVQVEDFLGDAHTQQRRALKILGLAGGIDFVSPVESYQQVLRRSNELAAGLEEAVSKVLRQKGVTAQHQVVGRSQSGKVLTFRWADRKSRISSTLELQFSLERSAAHAVRTLTTAATLLVVIDGEQRSATASLPAVPDAAGAELVLAGHIESLLPTLAARVMRNKG